MVLARQVIELMLLRRGPQDMPGDANTLYASGAAYCILLFIQVGLIMPFGHAALHAVLATVLLAFYVRVVLRMRDLSNRFNQTLIALFLVGTGLTLVMLAPTKAMTDYLQALSTTEDPQSVPMPSTIVTLCYVALSIWGLAIYSHIYRHALNCGLWFAVGVTMAFEVLLFAVFSLLG